MDQQEREKYLKAYYDNEENANKQMSFANSFAAGMMLIIWICYLTGFFQVNSNSFLLINLVFPTSILILLTPLLYVFFFKKVLRKHNYKYFAVFSFIFVIALLNIILPKHAILAWALCIMLTNHYYNPKLGLITFIVSIVLMLFCLYFAMYIGEYDPNLLGAGIVNSEGKIEFVYGIEERYQMLHQMLLDGENRYLKVFIYYYVPRAAIITILFFISNSLNNRTYRLLVDEIKVNSEQEKTKTELEVARDIQLSTVPEEFTATKDVEIQAELKPAKEVGGDFYDYFVLDNDHVALVIGDVSGKGIPAAMFMMKTITCFKNYIGVDKSPAEILKLVNKTIYQGNESHMFVTCFLAIINTKTGKMRFANAGHNHPIVGQKKNYKYLGCQSGFVLGGLEEAFVVDEEITLNNGDTITLYTDGITEAMNKNRELYGEKKLLELFNKREYSCLIELHHELKDDISVFTNGAEQSDDITYLTLKYHGDQYEYKEKFFNGDINAIPEMLDFLKEFAIKTGFGDAFISKGLVVADELLSNIVKYGYKDSKGQVFIRILHNKDQREVVFTIIDSGTEFNPFSVDNKPLEGDANKYKEGGLGILIVKNLASEYAYDRVNGKNITILKRKY